MQARQEFIEQELCKTKERENSLACELGTVKKEVCHLMCIPVVIYLLFEAFSLRLYAFVHIYPPALHVYFHLFTTHSQSSTHSFIMYIFIQVYTQYMQCMQYMIQSNESYLCLWYTEAGLLVPQCDGLGCIESDIVEPKCSHLCCLHPGPWTLTAQRETCQYKWTIGRGECCQ